MISAIHGYDTGYLAGFKQGEEEAARGLKHAPRKNPLYERALQGFQEQFVFRVAYRRGYQNGFEEGYSDGYHGRDNRYVARFWDLDANRDASQVKDAPRSGRDGRGTKSRQVTVPPGTPIRMTLSQNLTTKYSRPGDSFSAQVVQPVRIGDDVVIPEGSTIEGQLGTVRRPGRVKGRAELNLRFERVVLPGGKNVSIVATLTDILDKDKEEVQGGEGTVKGGGSKKRDTAVVGAGAGIGAVIGAIAGGGKGTAIGAASGGLIGLAGVLATRGKDITLLAGTEIEIQLDRAIELPVYR